VTFFILALLLRQRDLEFLTEPDFNWIWVKSWMQFFMTCDPALLPPPRPYVYLDAQYIVYGIIDVGLHWVAHQIEPLRAFFPNDLSFALGAALLTNIVAYALACTIFYAAMVRLTGYVVVSVLMAAGLFLAPQMINIHMARVDYLVTLPLMAIFYCSCVLAIGQDRTRHAVMLGLAVACAATLKLNGPFFGVVPALAAVASYRFDRAANRRLAHFIAISILVFLPMYVLLMGRFFYFLSPLGIITHYRESIALVNEWAVITSGPPIHFYNFGILMESGSGISFIALYLTCAAATLLIALWQGSRAAIFLVLLFVVFSAAGMLTMKYERGGYHLLPIFFAMIGFTAAAVMHSYANLFLKGALVIVGALPFALSLVNAFMKYQNVVAKRHSEDIAIQALKREPRDWLRTHVPPGTTVCIQTHSEWTLPPLDGFKVINGPLNMPHLDFARFAKTHPPNLNDLKKVCPIVVTSDAHRNMYDATLNRASPEMAARWRDFFVDLSRSYPPTAFLSPVPAYAKEIDINDLR
jgi:hypothetical protein